MDVDQEFEDLKKRLQPFPNYFQLELQNVSRNTWKQVKQKLEAEEEEAHICQSDMEKHRDKNLKACVYYELGDPEKAGRLIREVLNSSRNKNVNASAMMALIQYRNGMFAESNNIMRQLEALKDNGDTFLIDEADAEMAYGYSRIHVRYYTKAIELFEDVIQRQPVQHKQSVFTWKFGLALTLRRCFRFDLRTLHPNTIRKETGERVKKLLIDIRANCRNDVYISMACIEQADLYSDCVDPYTNEFRGLVERLIKEGVSRAPNDPVTLAKAGRLMRRICRFPEAEEYLCASIQIRKTSLAFHQLGLFLQGKLKEQKKPKTNDSRGWGRGTGRGARRSRSSTNSFREYQPIATYNRFRLPTSPILDSESMPRREGFTLENENDKGSSKRLLGKSSGNPIPEIKNTPPTVHRTRSDRLVLTVVGEEHKKTLRTKCDTVEDSEMTDAFDHLGLTSFIPPPKQSVANTQPQSSPILEYKGPMEFFSRILKCSAHDQVASYKENDTHQLEECVEMFQKSYDISQGRNCGAAYDMGLTYLQMTPPQYEKARDAFRKTFDSNFPLSRYRGFVQSGICLVHMSLESDSKRNDYGKDAFEMFKQAIRCWGLCQKNIPSSLKSIRQLISGGEGRPRPKKVKEVADLHYCVQEYGESLGLYKELKAELERSNDAKDLDITKSLIKNNVKLGNFSDVLDLILILVNSQEGFESKAFILEVLLEIIKWSISNENANLIKSVFDIYRRLTEYDGDDDDIVVIYDEEAVGGHIFGWLQTLSGLKIIKNDDNVPIYHPRRTGQMEHISNSEAVIFIITDQERETTYLKYLVDSALEAMHDKDRRLSKIIPITVNNCSLPSSLGPFKSLPYPRDNLNTDITSWLCSFCDILLSP